MIILSNVNHTFEAGSGGTTLMQLEFLPEIFSGFDLNFPNCIDGTSPNSISLFSEENKLIKIVNNIGIMRVVQRIVNELEEFLLSIFGCDVLCRVDGSYLSLYG